MQTIYGCFLKWWYPQNGPPKWSVFSKKTRHPTVLGNPQMVVYPHQKKASSISRESTFFMRDDGFLWAALTKEGAIITCDWQTNDVQIFVGKHGIRIKPQKPLWNQNLVYLPTLISFRLEACIYKSFIEGRSSGKFSLKVLGNKCQQVIYHTRK